MLSLKIIQNPNSRLDLAYCYNLPTPVLGLAIKEPIEKRPQVGEILLLENLSEFFEPSVSLGRYESSPLWGSMKSANYLN